MLAGYRLARVVARGAQGTVYEAIEPRTSRRVAIKRLPAAEPSEQEAARFALETAALASLSALSHPNIVTLLAAPEVDHARLLVMEWVDGAPFDAWADLVWKSLSRRDALRAIVECVSKISAAIASAHALGLVHRDLKPSNVLVSPDHAPTVLDFGIAKSMLLDAKLTRTDSFTGTPAWAAPEQIGRSTVRADVRVDVHGLGLLLHRALSGRCAVDPTLPFATLFHVIASETPPAPSRLRPGVPLELDAVVLKALEKDPARRYQTADAFHRDLERFLRGEPVEARPPRIGAVLRTLVRRHRTLAAAMALSLVAIIGGTAISVMFAIDAHRARTDADLRATQAEVSRARAVRMNDFFRGLLSRLRERDVAGERSSAREIIALAAASLEAEPHSPETEVALRETLGLALFEIGDYSTSATQFKAAVAAQRRSDPSDAAGAAQLLTRMARSQLRGLDAEGAAESALAVTELRASAPWPDPIRAEANELLAMASLSMRAFVRARAAIDSSVAEAIAGEDLHQLAMSYCVESLLLMDEGAPSEAALRAKLAVEVLDRVPEATVAERARVLHNAGTTEAANGNAETAIQYFQDSLRLRESEYPFGHPIFNVSRSALASALRTAGRVDEAVAVMEKAVDEFTARHESPHLDAANLRRHLAFSYFGRRAPEDLGRAVQTANESIREFAELGRIVDARVHSAVNILLRANRIAAGPEATIALFWRLPKELGPMLRSPTEAGWLRAVMAREFLRGPTDLRVLVDERMITVLREDLEAARRARVQESAEVLQISIALSQALLSTADALLQSEGRQLARDIVGTVRTHFGAGAGETRFVESLAQSE